MRTKQHYENLLERNPGTTVNLSLAARAVYSAKHGAFDHNADNFSYRSIFMALKRKYGENLSVSEVRHEMASIAEPKTEMIVRQIPESLRSEFKSKCAANRISQQDCIINLMREYVSIGKQTPPRGERIEKMNMYDKINAATDSVQLGVVVEKFLDSIGQNDPSETYEETANRLRELGMNAEAIIMERAAEKWHDIEA